MNSQASDRMIIQKPRDLGSNGPLSSYDRINELQSHNQRVPDWPCFGHTPTHLVTGGERTLIDSPTNLEASDEEDVIMK